MIEGFESMKSNSLVSLLLRRGVSMPLPGTVDIAPDVDVERIAGDITIYPGCRLGGGDLSIGPGCTIGREAPATVINCQLGTNVHLAGGYFTGATFLDGFKAGSGAHVRPGCLFEECSTFAHCVGVKQTIFMPWVTAGSLVNFCDALMAGGTSATAHSEIGSSFVHFNFTPHQDKATPSLLGDVAHGVLLNQAPIFLGGQGGLVGPTTIAYGTVLAAGQVWRRDVTEQGRLLVAPTLERTLDRAYSCHHYPAIGETVAKNLRFIGNLLALEQWYRVVRKRYMQHDPFASACFRGALQRLSEALNERLLQLAFLKRKVQEALELRGGGAVMAGEDSATERKLVEFWPKIEAQLTQLFVVNQRATAPLEVETVVTKLAAKEYLREIAALPAAEAATLSAWLSGVVDTALGLWEA